MIPQFRAISGDSYLHTHKQQMTLTEELGEYIQLNTLQNLSTDRNTRYFEHFTVPFNLITFDKPVLRASYTNKALFQVCSYLFTVTLFYIGRNVQADAQPRSNK